MMMDPRPPIEPILHPLEEVEEALGREDVECDAVRQTLAWLGVNEQWTWFFAVSNIVGREVSLLIDADGLCFVDWGTVSQVGLNPPEGARIPFKVWVHTHPMGYAYWSATDKQTLTVASSARLVESAIVLGFGQMKTSQWSATPASNPIASEGPLSQWTEEPVQVYSQLESPWEEEVES